MTPEDMEKLATFLCERVKRDVLNEFDKKLEALTSQPNEIPPVTPKPNLPQLPPSGSSHAINTYTVNSQVICTFYKAF
jgi:hypothetical protein